MAARCPCQVNIHLACIQHSHICKMLWFSCRMPDIEYFFSATVDSSFKVFLTLIQPVSNAIEDNPLLSRRREPPRAALNIHLVVNVVFKYVYLWHKRKYRFLKQSQHYYCYETEVIEQTEKH